MKPYFEDEWVTIYHADCRDVLPTLGKVDLVLTDPPWGTNTATNAQRFTKKTSPWWRNVDNSKVIAHDPIVGDKEEFDPAPILALETQTILWGANNFAHRLPPSNGWLIWDKRKGAEDIAEKGWPLGEAELAWTNVIGATRVYRNLWVGLLRTEQRGDFPHPTMKPTSLMRWCIGFTKDVETILDPYMGSGATLRAAKDMSRKAIGIEIKEKYCEIAAKRMSQMAMQL